MFPETKGRTLEEMDQIFNSDVPMFKAWEASKIPTTSRIEYDIEQKSEVQEEKK